MIAVIEKRTVVAKRPVGGEDWKFGISRCKVLDTRWMKKKVLLYNTGKYIQCPEINHNGKEY